MLRRRRNHCNQAKTDAARHRNHYAEAHIRSAAHAKRPQDSGSKGCSKRNAFPKAANLESALSGFLAERYEFRFNVLTEATEFRHLSDEGNGTFRPATERDLNAICLEAHRHGIDCWDRDVARMVHSADVREYHPFRQYFQRLPAWDGRDRLHDLATRVSDSPLWIQTFHRWMLGLAAQWAGLSDGLHAHSTAPCSSATNKDSESPPSAAPCCHHSCRPTTPTAWTSRVPTRWNDSSPRWVC